MPRGQPDFGMYAVKEATVSISDMGEVAARLGSIITYDKRGDVVDFDNFEEPIVKAILTDRVYPFGGHLTNETARSGCQCVRLRPLDVIGNVATISKRSTPLATSRLGVEVSFTAPPQYANIYLGFGLYSGTHHKTPAIMLDTRLRELSYYDVGGELVSIATYHTLVSHKALFFTLKLVVDFNTDKYVRCMFSNQEWDLSAYSIQSVESEEAPYFACDLTLENRTTSENVIYADDYILTQAEP